MSRIQMYLRPLIVFFSTLILSGCFLFPKPELPPMAPNQGAWTANGRAAIRANNTRAIVSFIWRHQLNETHIRLYGSFGKIYADLVVTPTISTLVTDDGTWQDSDSGRLLQSVLGWYIPVKRANRWLTRIFPKNQNFPVGPLNAFDGWRIEYLDGQLLNETIRPRRVRITGPDVAIMLTIDQWQVTK